MPVSCLDVVKGSLRKIGVLASGREPRTVDRDDAFETLKGLYRQMINNGTFGRLCDVYPTGDYVAGENQRIFRSTSDTLAITLPELISGATRGRDYGQGCGCSAGTGTIVTVTDDGAGTVTVDVQPAQPLSAYGVRTPRDCSVVVINDASSGNTYDFIYDAHQKRYAPIYDLAITGEAPLAFRDPEGLKAYLALQIVDEFSGQLGDATIRLARSFQTSLVSRFSMERETMVGVYV